MSELSSIQQTLLTMSKQLGGIEADVATIKSRSATTEKDVGEMKLAQARSDGRSSVISAIAGTVAGILTAIGAVVAKQLFGAPAA